MKKSKSRYFFRVLFVFFLVYVALLIAYESGYYETKVGNRATLTKEAMEQFEADLENGEMVDVKNYLVEEFLSQDPIIMSGLFSSFAGGRARATSSLYITTALTLLWVALNNSEYETNSG